MSYFTIRNFAVYNNITHEKMEFDPSETEHLFRIFYDLFKLICLWNIESIDMFIGCEFTKSRRNRKFIFSQTRTDCFRSTLFNFNEL